MGIRAVLHRADYAPSTIVIQIKNVLKPMKKESKAIVFAHLRTVPTN